MYDDIADSPDNHRATCTWESQELHGPGAQDVNVNVNNFLAVLLSDRSAFIFESLLPENIDVYATTAGNVEESSWGTY